MPVSARLPSLAARVVLASFLAAPAARAQGTEPTILPPQGLASPAQNSVPPGPAAPAEPARPAVTATKPPAPPAEAKISQDPQPTLQPDSASRILAAARRYAEIAAQGGWPSVPEGPLTKPGQSAAHIPAVRSRLAAEGEDAGDIASAVLDAPLAAAVKRFQWRHGLPETGIVGPATVKAMNVPAEARERALLYSADRLTGFDFAFGPRHVVVNIPSAAVEAV